MQDYLTPLFADFFQLEPGPAAERLGVDKAEFTRALQDISKVVHAALRTSTFHVASHEMYLDLFAGTGAMLIREGDDDDVIECVSVPYHELALETDGFNRVRGVYWRKKWDVHELRDMWPDGAFGDKLREKMRQNESSDVTIVQATIYDPKLKIWVLTVFWEDAPADDPAIWSENFRVTPWLTPRFYVVPGEPYGRGPGMIAMPNIKTLNKAREMVLRAAAIAIMGIWIYRDDSVFNPDTANFVPNAMIAVSSTGGGLGPSLAKLDLPGSFDISSVVIDDEREAVKQATFDDTLPPEAGAVRSPTEIVERMKRLAQDLGGVYGRLTLEIIVPLVKRVIDVLERKGMLSTKIKIDQLVTAMKVVSPIASGQQADMAQKMVEWVSIMLQISGPEQAAMVARFETLLPELGRLLGVEERFIRDDKENKILETIIDQLASGKAQTMIDQASGAGGGNAPAPAQNGAAVN